MEGQMPLDAPASTKQDKLHLVVLQHGLWGQSKNMGFLKSLLCKATEHLPVVVLNSDVNELYLTYEGMDACGNRLVTLITDTCQQQAKQGQPVTHLSLIGYSMGGLIIRYAAGKLFQAGLLQVSPGQKPVPLGVVPAAAVLVDISSQQRPASGGGGGGGSGDSVPAMLPVNFVTIASPHLGTWVEPTSWIGRTFNGMVPHVAARSGTQFMLLDRHAFGRPLLVNLSDPDLPFLKALSTFRHHMLLANTLHDRTVPYCTAAICENNPYDAQDGVPKDPAYPSIVMPAPRPTTGSGRHKFLPAVCSSKRASAGGATGVTAEGAERGVKAGGGGGAQQGEGSEAVRSQRRRKGWGFRVVFLLLLPLTLPLMLALLVYMVILGRKQWAAALSQTFDHSWVEAAAPASMRVSGTRSKRSSTAALTSLLTPANGGTPPSAATPTTTTAAATTLHAPAPTHAPAITGAAHGSISNGTAPAAAAGANGGSMISAFSGAGPVNGPAAANGNHDSAKPDVAAQGEDAGGAVDATAITLLSQIAVGGQGDDKANGVSPGPDTPMSADDCPLLKAEPDGGTTPHAAPRHDVLTALAGTALSVPPPALHSAWVRESMELPSSVGAAGGGGAGGPERSGRTGRNLDVSIDGGARELHVHDGLVYTAGKEREAQLWMMRQLNKMPWNKVDVDTRHYHAHAAIILRTPKKFMDNADCLQYLVDKMILDVRTL